MHDGTWELPASAEPNRTVLDVVTDLAIKANRCDSLEVILKDLIADLRTEHVPYITCGHDCCKQCKACGSGWPCDTADYITAAEVRMRDALSPPITIGYTDE